MRLFDLDDKARRYLLWKLQVEAVDALDALEKRNQTSDSYCTEEKCPKCGCQSSSA